MDKAGNYLSGITTLMNKQHINQFANLEQIEQRVLNNITHVDVVPNDYNMEVDKLARELGLDFGTGLKLVKLDDVDDEIPPRQQPSPPSVKSNKSKCSHCSNCSKCSRRSGTIPMRPQQSRIQPSREYVDNVKEDTRIDITDEHDKKTKIMEVFSDMRKTNRTGFSMNIERTRDSKSNKIEQICNIISTLDEEGVDIRGFTIPSMDSTMEEIDSVLNLVNMKMNRTRYSSLFEEIVIGGAEFMESKLDGTRAIPPFNWKPDYTGYSNTVSVKLHRMRYETSKLVGNSMEKLNIGSTARILMELLPSLLLYPKTNSNRRREHSDSGIAGSFGNIRGKVENEWDSINNI
jgi:hypothetical protein